MENYIDATDVASDGPPSEAWLFAQAILGRPIPRMISSETIAKPHHEEVRQMARFSCRYTEKLRRLQFTKPDDRRDRELLEWAAQISAEARDKLRAIQQIEAQERRAWHAVERFAEADSVVIEWNEADHPRASKGTPIGGQWISKGGDGEGGIGTDKDRAASSNEPSAGTQDAPNPHMLDMAHAWWQTKNALEQTRRDIAEIPKRIAREQAQVGRGGRYAYIHTQNLAKARSDLETAKALVPQLETQLRNLQQEYHDSGYDDIGYSAWTPGETVARGRGIEGVGRVVDSAGSPAGPKPTNVEVDIALTAVSVLQLGRAVLRKAAAKASNGRALGGQAAKTTPAKSISPRRLESNADEFVAKLPRTTTPKNSPANLYEIEHTGPHNITVSGGGVKFNIDGYRGSTILDAKHVGSAKSSPYVPGSSCPESVRAEILNGVRDELRRVRTIIESGSTPFQELEIITNSPEAKRLFERLLREAGVPGNVQLKP